MEPPSSKPSTAAAATLASEFAEECNNADTVELLDEILDSLSDDDSHSDHDHSDAENGDADQGTNSDNEDYNTLEEAALIDKCQCNLPNVPPKVY